MVWREVHIEFGSDPSVSGLKAAAPSPEQGDGPTLLALPSYGRSQARRIYRPLHRLLQAAPIVGREADLAAVSRLLDDPSVRLISLTGRSGVGKTRLALEVAWSMDAVRPNSVHFVSLAGLFEPDLLLSEIAAQLHLAALPGQKVSFTLMRTFERYPSVLMLDNFEHLLEAADLLSDLLDRCDGLQVLVTSQSPLHIRAERVVQLAPLPVPTDDHMDLTSAAGQPAIALYCDRARAVNDRFSLGSHNVASVVALCRQLEGLPLAIELAAARAVVAPAAQILSRLSEDRLDVLRSNWADAPRRHRDLRAAIRWTYQLLTPPQRDLLRRLSVVSGRFELEDVEALGGGESGDVLDRLSALVDLHLVDPLSQREWFAASESQPHADGEPGATEPNKTDWDGVEYELPPSIRDFAREELIASGESDRFERDWQSWLAGQARTAGRALDAPDPDACWAWLERAHERLVNALAGALASRRVAEALDLLNGLAPQWVRRGYEPAHRRLLERTIQLAAQHTPTRAFAEVLIWGALLEIRVLSGEKQEKYREWLDRGEQIARSTDDSNTLLRALDCAARVAPMTAEHERAVASVAEGLELARRVNSNGWLARFEVHSGRMLFDAGDDDGAVAIGLSALANARQAHDTSTVVLAAQFVQMMAPRFPQAAAALPPPPELVEMARSTHQTNLEAAVLVVLAVQQVMAGEVTAAAAFCRRVLELSGFDPSSYLAGYAVFESVEIASARGDHDLVARLHGRLLDSERLLRAPLAPRHLHWHDATLAVSRDALGQETFTVRATEGALVPWLDILAEVDGYLSGIGTLDPQIPPTAAHVRSDPHPEGLTDRQFEVVQLLAAGLTNKEIAQRLGITPKTVMNHTVAIYEKLGVRGRSETVAWAMRTGAVTPVGDRSI
jgi:predicted ATPase/DNA-binding CsgD family transcriptional regulator